MATSLETTLQRIRARAEAVVTAEHSAEVTEDSLFSFSDLDCICDVKLEDGWIRYVFLEGDDESSDALRRIG